MYVQQQIEPPPEAEGLAPRAFALLYRGGDLREGEAEGLFSAWVAGELDERAVAAMLIALRLKGEAQAELVGAAKALRAADEPFERPDYLYADTCGTGG